MAKHGIAERRLGLPQRSAQPLLRADAGGLVGAERPAEIRCVEAGGPAMGPVCQQTVDQRRHDGEDSLIDGVPAGRQTEGRDRLEALQSSRLHADARHGDVARARTEVESQQEDRLARCAGKLGRQHLRRIARGGDRLGQRQGRVRERGGAGKQPVEPAREQAEGGGRSAPAPRHRCRSGR